MESNIVKGLNEMNEQDIYSMMLFALFKLSNNPKYSTLSELVYLVDKESLFRLISVFQGITITIPKLSELKTLVAALELYQTVNLEGNDFKSSLKALKNEDIFEGEIKNNYFALCEVLKDYDFSKGK